MERLRSPIPEYVDERTSWDDAIAGLRNWILRSYSDGAVLQRFRSGSICDQSRNSARHADRPDLAHPRAGDGPPPPRAARHMRKAARRCKRLGGLRILFELC